MKIPAKLQPLVSMTGELLSDWSADNVMRLSAALAYYSVFSLAPLLVIIVSILSLTLGQDAARGQVATELRGLFGEQAGETIQTALAATYASKTAGFLAAAIGTAILLFGASTVFAELKNALNSIWGVTLRPGTPLRAVFRDRLLCFSLVLCVGALMILSLALSSLLTALNLYITAYVALPSIVWNGADFLLSFLLTALLFAVIYKLLPDVELSMRDVAPSAAITAMLFTVGKTFLALYLGKSAAGSVFGAAGALVAVLLWVYYVACILFLGAELAKLFVRHFGAGVIPNRHAMLVSEAKQAIPSGDKA